MVTKIVKVSNPTGLHLRPAGKICDTAMQYESKITFIHGNTTTNCKSLLSVLGAGIKYGAALEFFCEGPDEEEALAAMVTLIESGMSE